MQIENDVPKHKKKKESSTSKSKVKSKHKHEYIECLLITKERKYPYLATYCKTCGKIGDLHFFECERTDKGMYRQLNAHEVYEKYKGLEKIYVDDNIWQKYVPIEKAGEDS